MAEGDAEAAEYYKIYNEDPELAAFLRQLESLRKILKNKTTLMIGTDDEKVDACIELIRKECGHSQRITVNMPYVSGTSMVNYATMPMQVEVGGATIFVVNVDRFEKF